MKSITWGSIVNNQHVEAKLENTIEVPCPECLTSLYDEEVEREYVNKVSYDVMSQFNFVSKTVIWIICYPFILIPSIWIQLREKEEENELKDDTWYELEVKVTLFESDPLSLNDSMHSFRLK